MTAPAPEVVLPLEARQRFTVRRAFTEAMCRAAVAAVFASARPAAAVIEDRLRRWPSVPRKSSKWKLKTRRYNHHRR